MITDREKGNCSGAGIFALGTLVVAAVLFAPLPSQIAVEPGRDWFKPDLLGPLLALGLSALGFWAVRKRFGRRGSQEKRRLRNGMAILAMQALALRIAWDVGHLPRAQAWNWWPSEAWLWTPWFLTTGLAVMLLGSRLGLLISVSGVLLLYLRADPGPLPLVGCLVSSIFGIVLLRRSARRLVFQASAGAGSLLGIIALIEGIRSGGPIEAVAAATATPLLVGLVSGFAVVALLPVMEWILGELSDATLAEYSDHPLLDELKEKAPGTWHHTLNVADLAEKAAAAIGARALFCKTAALYHDVGKLKDPNIFAENITGPSPHEEFDPRTSAARIIEHVTYGLELARKHRLPKAFRDIIAEHHGISVVRFFYLKACSQLREGETAESVRSQFCYPGPPPTSRESGIIALADVVEAATRAFHAKSDAEARTFIRGLIAERIAEGELANCPLTLIELARIEATFIGWLRARAHSRPAYPQSVAAVKTETSEWAKGEGAAQPA